MRLKNKRLCALSYIGLNPGVFVDDCGVLRLALLDLLVPCTFLTVRMCVCSF